MPERRKSSGLPEPEVMKEKNRDQKLLFLKKFN
jgi:hypothetical protein